MRDLGDRAFYCLVSLWCYTAENCSDGTLTDMDAIDIAEASNWPCERAAEWLDYLIGAGWLDWSNTTASIHDWQEMQPWAARDRSKQVEANRRNALARWDKVRNGANSHAIAMQSQCEPKMQSQCPQPIPNPYPTQPNLVQESKAAPSVKADAVKEAKKAINRSIQFDPATFTLSGITDADRAQWEGYAPGCNIDAEIAAFLDYMQTHPEALERTVKTGAWKAALNTRFRNVAKYGSKGGANLRVSAPAQERPHPFFDNKGVEFASAKMMRRMAEEEAVKAAQDAARLQAIEEARYDS
jgi:hypothetical protein